MTEHKEEGPSISDQMKLPKINMSRLDFKNALGKCLGILKLDRKIIEEVAVSEKYNAAALVFLILGAVAGPIGQSISGMRQANIVVRMDFGSAFLSALIAVIVALFGVYIISLVAIKLFKGKGTLAQLFRVMGLAFGVYVLSFLGNMIPGLNFILWIWLLFILFKILKTVFKTDDVNSVLIIIVSMVAIWFVTAVLVAIGLPLTPYSMKIGAISITY